MKIQWSTERVLELLCSLDEAADLLQQSLGQLSGVQSALSDANPSGDDKAVRKLKMRYAEAEQQLRRLANQLSEYREASRRADMLMCEAESVFSLAETSVSEPAKPYASSYASTVVSAMPEMRIDVAPFLPDWFSKAAADANPFELYL